MAEDLGRAGPESVLVPEMVPSRPRIRTTIARFLTSDAPGAVGLVVIAVMVFIVIFGVMITPYTKDQIFTEVNPEYDPAAPHRER